VATEGSNGIASLLALLGNRSLPVVRRGYDQETTDRLLSQLEAGIQQAVGQRASLLARVGELEQRIAEGQEREEAVTEALVVATQIRSDSERAGKEIEAKYQREAEAMESGAREKADAIVRDAESQAERILEDSRLKVRVFEQEIRDAERLAHQARARLTVFLKSLLTEIERRGTDLGSAVDDLIARAGEAADGDREERADWLEPEPEPLAESRPWADVPGENQPRTEEH
jgi:cell division initiation protein